MIDSGEGTAGPQGMHSGAGQPSELYPLLMRLPELSPEQRAEVEQRAHERMQSSVTLISQGLERLARAADDDEFAAMQEATAQVREGVAQFESALSAHRALAEGQAPRAVAMEWFRREMNLVPAKQNSDAATGPWGLSWFHAILMVLLVGFAAAMLWMYYHKMQRAAGLLRALTGGTESAAAAPAPTVGTPSVGPSVPAEPPRPATPGDQSRSGRWSGKLRVAGIFQETPDVKTFRLMNPLGGVLPFDYMPGQFLTLSLSINDAPVRRSYTIASSPTQHDYAEITVKHKEGGEVSGFLHDRVREGDLLDCSGPSGSFIFTGRECKCILLIGGGVGITPLMSVIRYLTDRSWPGDIYLLDACRTPEDIIFREELQYLQHRHPNLRVVITVSRPEGTDWPGPTGRITKELIAQTVPDLPSRYVHICGPMPLMEAVQAILADLGIPRERIKTEAFGPALGKPEPTKAQTAAPAAAGADEKAARVALPTVSFSQSEKSAPLPPDKAVLDVADEIGVEIDNSCRVGICGLCKVKLLSGQVMMAVEDALTPEDKAQGIVLACQAKSMGNVTVDA